YAPGYIDAPMTWGTGGPEAQYTAYRGNICHVLQRPHAVAFVGLGGVLRFVAEAYDSEIVQRFVQGPSVQVSQYNRGHSVLLPKNEEEVMFTTDQVSESEISALLGRIPGSHPALDTTLWPPPSILEAESLHMRGYLSAGAYDLLENIRHGLMEEGKYVWRTPAQWKVYLQKGSKGRFTPSSIPQKEDFMKGLKLLERSFPVDWANTEVAELIIPE
ncbi:hypothetical protein DFH06DRAFT_955726, partial [Mycena polygramma]